MNKLDTSEIKLLSATEQAEANMPLLLASLDSQIAVLKATVELHQQHGRMLLEIMASMDKPQLYKRASVFGISRQAADGAMKIACTKIDWGNPASVARVIQLSGLPNKAALASQAKAMLEARAKINLTIKPTPDA